METVIYIAVLFSAAGIGYLFLLLLLALSKQPSATRRWLMVACALTAGACFVMGWGGPPTHLDLGLLELASTGCWVAFLLHLLYQQLSVKHPTLRVLFIAGGVITLPILASTFVNVIFNDSI